MNIKICGITTRPGTAKVMFNNLRFASQNGYDCSIICQPVDNFGADVIDFGAYIPVDMNRGNVSPFEVLKSTYRLYKIFKKEKYDIIQYASSNAGLYASIAGWLAKIPVRIFCQWGIPYIDYQGPKRFFFKFMEWLTCKLSTSVQPDSLTNLEFAINESLYKRNKATVLGIGSAQGVSLEKFDINKKEQWRKIIREQYNIAQNQTVFCFVGRIVPQKGVNELLDSFMRLNNESTSLLVVGAPDEIDSLNKEILEKAKRHKNIIFTGEVTNPEYYHAAADFFVLPSYREGFPNTILEAGALGIPSIVTRINGMIDLVDDSETGFICEVQSTDSLYQSMKKAVKLNVNEYSQMSNRIYRKVRDYFDSKYIQSEFLNNMNKLFEKSRSN